jgi:peptide/nickel transport system substrate-binding protein
MISLRIRRLVLLPLLATAACDRSKSDAAAAGETGGTLIIAVPAEPETLFPPNVTMTQEGAVVGVLFDRLADIGPSLETYGDAGFRPRLATAWRWASDSLSIAFTLDSAARWHDGAPVRAEDVRYTFRVFTNDSVGATNQSLLGNIDSVSVRDSLTAVFWFKRRMPQQFYDATYPMQILPSHLLDTIPMGRVSQSAFAKNPVGTGRFRFVRWEPHQRIEVIADTANSRGRAKLDRVIWSITTDAGSATVKLFAGEADVYEAIRRDDLGEVARTPTLKLVDNRALTYGFLGFNLRDAKDAKRPHPIFGDSLVRRALHMAVDRERIVRNVYDSLGLVALGPAPRALIADTTAFKQLPYDVAAARALLDSAGWRDSNADGVRDRNGVPLAFEILVVSSSKARQDLATLLQEQFRAMGVKVTLQLLEGPAMGERVDSQHFDAFMGGWQTLPGLVGLRQTWASTGDGNSGRYHSVAFDALLDSALSTLNRDASRRYWGRAFQQIVNDVPAIWLSEPRSPLVVHRRFILPPLRPDGWYTDLADWRVDPAQRIDRDRLGLGSAR